VTVHQEESGRFYPEIKARHMAWQEYSQAQTCSKYLGSDGQTWAGPSAVVS
jgi:hypothetical protein